jgi:hypothetical protein
MGMSHPISFYEVKTKSSGGTRRRDAYSPIARRSKIINLTIVRAIITKYVITISVAAR